MKKNLNLIFASSIGNILENYDYILYANFSLIISRLFFPSSNIYISMIATFGVFAAGFIARPIGSLIFGYIGDKYSRKIAFASSVTFMAIATSLIGLLPSFSTIGILAPILLTILRLIQGISIGGETSGYMTYLMESKPNSKHKSLLGSLAFSSTALGLFLAFLASFICNFFYPNSDFAWRIAFLLSLPFSLIGIYVRFKLEDGIEFQNMKNQNCLSKNPIKDLFKNYKSRFFIIFTIFISISVPFYIFFAFISLFLSKISHYSLTQVSLIYLICTLIFALIAPISGLLSDKIGKDKILISSIIFFALFIHPIFNLILSSNFITTFIGCILFITSIALYQASVPSLILNIFPTKVRAIGTALSFNLVAAIFGGTTPLILTTFLQNGFSYIIVAYYLSASSLVSLTGLIIAKKKGFLK